MCEDKKNSEMEGTTGTVTEQTFPMPRPTAQHWETGGNGKSEGGLGMLPEMAIHVCVLFCQPHIHPTSSGNSTLIFFWGYHATLSSVTYHSILCPHDLGGTDSSLALWMSV